MAALKATRANLINNDIWAKVIWGDIGNPEKLERTLEKVMRLNFQIY